MRFWKGYLTLETSHEVTINPGIGHEERDANIRAVTWFVVALIITLIVVLLLMRWLFSAFPQPQAEFSAPATTAEASELPPEPRLQVNAPEDLAKMRREEDAILDSYGWVDNQNGIVRIPISRAMELIAQRGLPPLKHPGR